MTTEKLQKYKKLIDENKKYDVAKISTDSPLRFKTKTSKSKMSINNIM